MTKDIIVSIKGLQSLGAEDNDSVELISVGTYKEENDKKIISYEEVDEDNQEITNVKILISKEQIEIMKSGASQVHMVFHENQKTTSCYQTPFGDLMMGIDTTKIKCMEQEEAMMILLEYGLDINYNHVADCDITIKVMAKGKN